MLIGGNPFTTTSIYGLILYLRKKMGNTLLNGWNWKYVIKGLEKLMKEENIDIIKGHEVTNIISNK